MSDARHTPGPWTVSDPPDALVILGPGGVAVASINCEEEVAEETAEANARLIAAAPAMATALRRIIDALGEALPEDV